jgi:hypothetical protein
VNALEIGVFVDAHHLLSVRRQDRVPAAILRRVANAAMQLALTSGFAQRVIVADCGNPPARQVTEDFGLNGGFRMRHVPQSHGVSRSAVIVAEIVEALCIPTLRTIVAIGPVLDIAPAIDSAHRAGKTVIVMTGDVKAPGAMEAVVQLPLDTSVLHGLVAEAIAQLRAENKHFSDHQVLHQRLRQLQPGFSPLHYGYRDSAHMMRMLRADKLLDESPLAAVGGGQHANSDVRQVNRPAHTVTRQTIRPANPNGRQVKTPGRPTNGSGRPPSEPNEAGAGTAGIRALCAHLARDRQSATELVAALREVLDVIEKTPYLQKQAVTGTLQTKDVSAGFRAAAPNYASGLFDMKFSQIALAAISGSNWRLMRNELNPADLRLVHGRIDIPGYTRVPRSKMTLQ